MGVGVGRSSVASCCLLAIASGPAAVISAVLGVQREDPCSGLE